MGASWKGGGGQREVAKILKAWWSPIDPEAVFASTPKSGGWQKGPDFNACGDVMCNKPFPFSVEVKFREAWTLQNVIDGKASPVWGWWRQAQEDATKLSLEPVLWFRKCRHPWVVLMRWHYVSALRGITAPDRVFGRLQLVERNVGAHPCLYLGKSFQALDPKIFT